jgi:hypothetical protein
VFQPVQQNFKLAGTMKPPQGQCTLRKVAYLTLSIVVAIIFVHQVHRSAERRIQGHRDTYDFTVNKIVDTCKRNLPSHSQDKEEELIMELFYPKAKPGGGFFVEAGGLDGVQ